MSSKRQNGKSNSEMRSLPWNQDEYLFIDGTALIYTARGSDGKPTIIDVHIPGCKTIPFAMLLQQEHAVVMPRKIRTERFG